MDRLTIERHGGLAGLPARGEIDVDDLSVGDRKALESLFRRRSKLGAAPGADRFIFLVTRLTPSGARTVEIPEHLLPKGLADAVVEELP